MTRPVLFDASRLVSRNSRSAPTGIDRVCLAYAEWLLTAPAVELIPVRGRRGGLVAVDRAWFADLVRSARERWNGDRAVRRPEDDALDAALRAPLGQRVALREASTPAEPPRTTRRLATAPRLLASRRMPPPPEGALYLNAAHTGLEDDGILVRLKKAGVECAVLLHDLIPITHPEYCRPGDDRKHRRRLDTILTHADAVIVNSRYTGDELHRFAKAEGRRPPRTIAAHLGVEEIFRQRPPSVEAAPPYFLHVGTIEGRKNLAFLLTIWSRLAEVMGEAAPQLVLVGSHGWESEAVLDHLERSPRIQRLVHHVAGVGDEALMRLMAGAKALLAPSSVEGFDLPAVEARTMGVPVIASDIPVHREVVPDAVLVDPIDGLGWLQAIQQAMDAHPLRPACFSPTWTEHFAIVGAALDLTRSAAAPA
ncbi:glycosyltransferase family 4 protein [Brevundimonas sp.]|uniref:glycosyltransferase family 4 protein n=1 Tax=Brevundimonas sp. TaxID=1871086 RepID=UPI003D6C7AFF